MAYIHKLPKLDEEVLHFSLQGLLPADQSLALYTTWGTLSLLASKENHPYLLLQEQFTAIEVGMIVPLLGCYPYHCPYEVLHASFQHRSTKESVISRSRTYLREARNAGIWDQEMRPIRNGLSRARLKLRAFGIEILSIHETGYMLLPKEGYEPETSEMGRRISS